MYKVRKSHSKWLIIFALLSFSLSGHLNAQTNHSLKSSTDFTGKTFKNVVRDCGKKVAQGGSRTEEALITINQVEGITVTGGHFECSRQNVIFINNSNDIKLVGVSAKLGSDNLLEIRNSEVWVEQSSFSHSPENKCLETENSFVVYINNKFERCRNGFDMETTITGTARKLGDKPDVAIFLDNKFRFVRDDGFNCHDRTNGTVGLGHIFLKGNKFSGGTAGYRFRKFGKRKTCRNRHGISAEMEMAIRKGNFPLVKQIAYSIIESAESR